jgi:hypothetical protein
VQPGDSYLAEDLAGLGEFADARDARESALAWAERSGEADAIAWSALVAAEGAYHAGSWDAALQLALAHLESEEALNASYAHSVRGRIALARGDGAIAAADADRILAYAESSDNRECYSLGYSLRALTLEAQGSRDETAEACTKYLWRWDESPLGNRSSDLVAIAPILVDARRSGELLGAARRLPAASQMRGALEAMAEDRLELAVERYAAIGALPAEARARELAARQAIDAGRSADAALHATAALDFYRRVGATLDGARVESLLATAEARLRDLTA